MRNPTEPLTERDFVEEALNELASDASCTLVKAITIASTRLEGRVPRTDLWLRLKNTHAFVSTMTRIWPATGEHTTLVSWDEKPGRTHAERVALLEKVLADL